MASGVNSRNFDQYADYLREDYYRNGNDDNQLSDQEIKFFQHYATALLDPKPDSMTEPNLRGLKGLIPIIHTLYEARNPMLIQIHNQKIESSSSEVIMELLNRYGDENVVNAFFKEHMNYLRGAAEGASGAQDLNLAQNERLCILFGERMCEIESEIAQGSGLQVQMKDAPKPKDIDDLKRESYFEIKTNIKGNSIPPSELSLAVAQLRPITESSSSSSSRSDSYESNVYEEGSCVIS